MLKFNFLSDFAYGDALRVVFKSVLFVVTGIFLCSYVSFLFNQLCVDYYNSVVVYSIIHSLKLYYHLSVYFGSDQYSSKEGSTFLVTGPHLIDIDL